jgi:uncharacterized protein YbaR (Trm112 family)
MRQQPVFATELGASAAQNPRISPQQRTSLQRSRDLSLHQSLDLLACPCCLQPLRLGPEALVCAGCGRIYPILDGIPILLIDRAAQAVT